MAWKTEDDRYWALEWTPSTTRLVALSALLLCAALLMICPAVVACVAMLDPSVLDDVAASLNRLSPLVSYLAYARWVVPLVAVILLLRPRKSHARVSDETRPGAMPHALTFLLPS